MKKLDIEFCIENIKESWSFEKLTEEEQTKIIDLLSNMKIYSKSFNNIYGELNNVYYAFLLGLGYKPVGWRE